MWEIQWSILAFFFVLQQKSYKVKHESRHLSQNISYSHSTITGSRLTIETIQQGVNFSSRTFAKPRKKLDKLKFELYYVGNSMVDLGFFLCASAKKLQGKT